MPQPPPQDAPQESILFQKFSGLKNTVSAERLKPEELATAVNVDLDDAGQIRRRRGFDLKLSANCHSLFGAAAYTYVVKDGVLGILNLDFSFRSLGVTVGPEHLAYVQVGPDVYFSSSVISGHILPDSVSVVGWGASTSAGVWISPVVNPSDTIAPIAGKLLGKPPLATALAYLNGRIYLASGRAVWATELYMYDYVDKNKNYQYYESDVTMIGAVTDGLYVGTQTDVWFVGGTFSEMKRVPIVQAGALPGSLVSVPAELVIIKQQTSSKNAVLFMTTTGLYAGMDSGQCFNLTQDKVLFPAAIDTATMFRQQDGLNQYISVMNSAGTPASTANIGDYAEAEIRRFQGA